MNTLLRVFHLGEKNRPLNESNYSWISLNFTVINFGFLYYCFAWTTPGGCVHVEGAPLPWFKNIKENKGGGGAMIVFSSD